MNRKKTAGVFCCAVLLGTAALISGRAATGTPNESKRLLVLWTSGDREVALKMAFMYAGASRQQQWWDDITILIWGPSARLLAEDNELQQSVRAMQKRGIKFQACIACADSYGVTPNLRALGVEVKFMGKPLTDMLQSGWTLLSV